MHTHRYTSPTLTRTYSSRYIHTGWRKPIRCLKLHIIFCKRATNYRALLRKKTYKDMAFYDSTQPCTYNHIYTHICRYQSPNVHKFLMNMHTYIHICACMNIGMHNTKIHLSIRIHTGTHHSLHLHIFIFMQIHICIYKLTYIHIYADTYLYI